MSQDRSLGEGRLTTFLLLLAAITSVGSANGAGPADPHQAAQNAEIAMLRCYYGQAAVLDDHISDAGTIAKAVVEACHAQFDDWKFAAFAEMQPMDATRFYQIMEQDAPNMATEVVLRVRAASKH